MSADKLRLFHEEMMQEEGIKVSNLPIEIQKKIRGFNLQMKKLERNPEDESLFRQLEKSTVRIGDAIQNFIENDYDDDDDEDEDSDLEDKKPSSKDNKSASKDNKPASNSSDEKSSKENTEKSVRTEKQKPTNGSFGNSMMEKKIMTIMESRGDNRIKISDLESIIGKEPEYPEQKVNKIKLRKVFLSNDYRLI